jgi:hypothetical protein
VLGKRHSAQAEGQKSEAHRAAPPGSGPCAPGAADAELGVVVGRDLSAIEINDEARPFSMNRIGRSHQPYKTIDSEYPADVRYFRGV